MQVRVSIENNKDKKKQKWIVFYFEFTYSRVAGNCINWKQQKLRNEKNCIVNNKLKLQVKELKQIVLICLLIY